MRRAPDRILAVQLRRLGDLVLATPSFRALKAAWPNARLSVLTEEPFHEILAGNPDVDEVVLHPRKIVSSLRTGFELSRRGFDLAIDFHGNPTSARLTAQSGAPIRVGWATGGRSLAYNRTVRRAGASPPRYTADQKLDLVRELGIPAADARPEVYGTPADRDAARDRIVRAGVDPDRPFLVAAPASRRAYKEWLPDRVARTLDLFSRETGAIAILAGGPGETERLETVARAAEGNRPPVVGLGSIREWIGLLAGAALFFGPDGGAKHIAQALGTPTLAYFGPQDPATWTLPGMKIHGVIGARRPDCRIHCSERPEPCACLAAVRAESVAARLVDLWRTLPAGSPA